jgi:uncharacterized membrane protein YgdD (TMEM256/DUF423 family)
MSSSRWSEVERFPLLASGIAGFLAVALGAFGAHGLKAQLAPLADGAQRLEWWNTAAHYHLMHALALGLVAWLASRAPSAKVLVATLAFVFGIVLFSGSLYLMTLTGQRWLGAVTPLGGLGFLVGWASIVRVAAGLRE